jgi:hypothetical protein
VRAARAGAQRRQPARGCPKGERSEATVDSEQKVAVLSSHVITLHFSSVPGVEAPGTKPAHRHRVRCSGADGVQEQGEAATGLTWNTGYPYDNEKPCRKQVTTGLPMTSAPSEDDVAEPITSKVHRPFSISSARRQTKRRDEVSGSLSSRIVAFEPSEARQTAVRLPVAVSEANQTWGTADGLDPRSSKGSVPANNNQCLETHAPSPRS